ncbi:MAG: hypothetical protein ACREP6_03115 [Candidatus Binataceae bacterium]
MKASKSSQALSLDAMQRDALLPHLRAFADAAADTESRASYVELESAIRNLEIAPELVPMLGVILEVTLQSGRARRENGPGAEISLASLYQKTPRGAELAASLISLNSALNKLAGETIESMSASSRIPGTYMVTIKTGSLQLVIRLGAAGASVDSLEVAL